VPEAMWRAVKREGVGNVALERVPIPEPGPGEVLVRTQVSLISRGSELWRRYERPEAIDPVTGPPLGYSTTGTVVRVGEGVTQVAPGARVVVGAPHAEYSVGSMDEGSRQPLHPLSWALSFEEGTFHPLSTSATIWTRGAQITERDTVVVLGQGIVGNMVMQFARRYRPARLIAVDALALRCRLAREVGAPEVVHAGEEDPVAAVRRLTDGTGASIVVDCVGGRAGLQSFAQAQDMLAPDGLLQLIGLYHGAPLPLDASKIMRRRLLGGALSGWSRAEMAREAMAALAAGEVHVQPLITHRFPGHRAKEAFDLLYEHPDEAMGVLMLWA
jgi:threonine dehydrogenase-like Zn-dependent dehydrogenase